MQRKSGFPVSNCNIKMPEHMNLNSSELYYGEDDIQQQQRRQQLINFGHAQWGFNNWNWSVTKQDLDFVDFTNGKYCAGVAAYVSITIKSMDIHRENVGYATSLASSKGFAIYKSRKSAITNGLRETLLSFGGSVATELMDMLESREPVEPHSEPTVSVPAPGSAPVIAPAHVPVLAPVLAHTPAPGSASVQTPAPAPVTVSAPVPVAPLKQDLKSGRMPRRDSDTGRGVAAPAHPPVAKAHPMPTGLPPPRAPLPRPNAPLAAPVAPQPLRPNSNVSFVLPMMPPLYGPPRLGAPMAAPHVFPNGYYECSGPWHFTYESYDRHHGNVNLNFNMPPKNLVVNSRAGSVECKSACRSDAELQYGAQQGQGCWIKPTIFYDGFWTEQKVKKWVAEQVEKQFPEDAAHAAAPHPAASPAHDAAKL